MLNNSNDLMSAVQVAMRFEGQILASSPSEVCFHVAAITLMLTFTFTPALRFLFCYHFQTLTHNLGTMDGWHQAKTAGNQ